VSDVKERFTKIMTVALDPGAFEGEAMAAFAMLRKLVHGNPSLTMPRELPPPPPPPSPPEPAIDSYTTKVTGVGAFWFLMLLNSLSEEAFKLGLKYQITCDPLLSQTPMTLQIKHEGPTTACKAFTAHLNWWINYINSQPPRPV